MPASKCLYILLKCLGLHNWNAFWKCKSLVRKGNTPCYTATTWHIENWISGMYSLKFFACELVPTRLRYVRFSFYTCGLCVFCVSLFIYLLIYYHCYQLVPYFVSVQIPCAGFCISASLCFVSCLDFLWPPIRLPVNLAFTACWFESHIWALFLNRTKTMKDFGGLHIN